MVCALCVAALITAGGGALGLGTSFFGRADGGIDRRRVKIAATTGSIFLILGLLLMFMIHRLVRSGAVCGGSDTCPFTPGRGGSPVLSRLQAI